MVLFDRVDVHGLRDNHIPPGLYNVLDFFLYPDEDQRSFIAHNTATFILLFTVEFTNAVLPDLDRQVCLLRVRDPGWVHDVADGFHP